MNRSILIVICDFLLVSLLLFSTPDLSTVTRENAAKPPRTEMVTNQPDAGQDLAAAMRLALEQEQQRRELLLTELEKARQTSAQRQQLLSEREKQAQNLQQELAVREQQAQKYQQELQSREEQAARLQQQQTQLQRQFSVTQTNLLTLRQQLQNTSTEAILSKEKLAAMEAEARKQAEQAAALQQQLAQLSQSNQIVLNEKQQLATRLEVTEAEKRLISQQAARMAEEVKIERQEKAQLAEGMKTLATNSVRLAQEMRKSQPLTPNMIFNQFVTNRVQARLSGLRGTLLGMSNRRKDTETVLVTDGTNTYALCHVDDTPLALGSAGADWQQLTGTLGRGMVEFPVRAIYFGLNDPRLVWMPVSSKEVSKFGCKVYHLTSDPYKFQDAVLVGTQEGYYGECRFEIDLTTPGYVRLDRSFLKGLFGKFNPSRGDLVFSRTGELLGIMVNNTYCLMIRNFEAGAMCRLGDDLRAQHTGAILAQLYSQLTQLPFKLQ